MNNVYYILLGWLLGLLGPRIIELIQRHYKKKEIRESLFVEFQDIRGKLAMNAFLAASRSDCVDRALLKWVEPSLRACKHSYEVYSLADKVKPLLDLDDSQLHAIYAVQKGGTFGLKKYALPFLNSQITSLHIFSAQFRQLALGIQAEITMLNEEIDAIWFHYTKTFDSSMSQQNHAIIRKNIEKSYETIVRISHDVIDKIERILSMESK